MTVNKINPDDKELRFRDLINTINDTIDELNSASNVHYVKKAGDVIQGTLTANGTQGVMFAATGGGFSRPITFEDDNLPFNNTSGTTVAFLSTQGSFNLTGRINFVETSASPYSWRFLPDYGNNELKLQGANNTTIMTITDSHVKFENDVEIEEDLILGGKATVGAQASGAWDVMPKHQVEAQFLPKTGGEITGNLTVGGEFTYGRAKNISGTDLDTLTTPGFYDGDNLANAPNGNSNWFYIEVQRHSQNNNWVCQRATALNHSNYATWVRNRSAGVWQPWRQVWDSQTFDPASKLNVSGGSLTGSLLVTSSLAVQATANNNAHVWLRNDAGKNRGLMYWDRNTGTVHLRVYVDDGNGNDIVAGNIALRPNGTIDFNGNTVWHEGNVDPWAMQPIGVPIPVFGHISGVSAPPRNKGYRYVNLTAGQTGPGQYNEGILTNETVSGSAPLINATAVINLPASPMHGQTIHLINTERRFIRAGSAGTVQDDAIQEHRHPSASGNDWVGIANGSASLNYQSGGNNNRAEQMGTGDGRMSNETRPRNIGATYFMRIL